MAVIETLNPEIIQDLKKVSEVEQREIGAVIFADTILHPEINAKYEDWLYQKVDKDEEEDVKEEFALQAGLLNEIKNSFIDSFVSRTNEPFSTTLN